MKSIELLKEQMDMEEHVFLLRSIRVFGMLRGSLLG